MRMRSMVACATFAVACAVCRSPSALAQSIPQDSPLTLYYTVQADATPGLYDYAFRLVLDNHDGTFLPGQGFGGIVFGDVNFGNSPLAGFVLSPGGDLGPFSGLTPSGDDGTGTSYHNGPTLGPVFGTSFNPIFWYPTGIGASLTFSGVSSSDPTSLDFSTYLTSGLTTVGANFEPAILVPEPGSIWMVLMAMGLGPASAALAARARRGSPVA